MHDRIISNLKLHIPIHPSSIMSIKSTLLWRVIPAITIVIAAILGWFFSHESPVGLFFATVVPLSKGVLPPSIVGQGRMTGTPEVPDELMPQPRPINEKFLDLPGGYKMPQQGLGMCCRPTAYDDVLVYRTILWYLLSGGRHIDGAHLYLNHKAIGKGIAEAIKRGVPREEIFVTTKVFPTEFGYESTLKWVVIYLQDLGLEYIDLVLLHFPSLPPLMSSPCSTEGKDATTCRKETWKALSELREKGLIRNAGVSNFALQHVKDLEGVGAPVANNQIQFNPFVPAHVMETVEYCHENNITITAHSPLGGLTDKSRAFSLAQLNQMAAKYNKRVASIMLRWAIQRGFVVIPGTGNPEHMKENMAVYQFELSDEDMKIINELKYTDPSFIHLDARSAA